MAWIPENFIEELQSHTSIEDVVAQYVPLKRKGGSNRYWACCPFHKEKTPSFSVNVEQQFYYCFGCHASGSVFRFVQEMEHVDFPEAVRILAERAHMQVPEEKGGHGGERRASSELRERILEANAAAAHFYHAALWTPEGAEVLDYLYRRGLNDSDIRRFGLGAAPRGGSALISHLRAKGYDDALLRTAGLAVERDGKLRDMFRNRAIFPIIQPPKRVVGFGGRVMGDGQPKYLNTPDTPVFNKRKGLYGLNFASKERSVGHQVLVEGYMDTVSLRKHGVAGVVATLGTALTQEQAMLIKRNVPEVWISYDGDAAGQKAALRALEIFDGIDGLAARVIDYPAGQDPDDFIKANGLEGFERLPRYDAAEYRMLRARDGLDMSTQDGVTQYAMRCCEILRGVKDPILRENYLRKLAGETGYDREVLAEQVGAVATAPERGRELNRRPRRHDSVPAAPVEEQALLTLLARGAIPKELVRVEDFSRKVTRLLAEGLLAGRSAASLLEGIEDDAERAEAALAIGYEHIPDSREECLRLAESSLSALRKNRLRERMAAIEAEIGSADPARKEELYSQLRRITKAIEEDDR